MVLLSVGSYEEHRDWDARKELRSRLEEAGKVMLRENYGMEDAVDRSNFFCKLLCDNAVIEALRKEEKDSSFGFVFCCFGQNEEEKELAALIKQKRETFFESL